MKSLISYRHLRLPCGAEEPAEVEHTGAAPADIEAGVEHTGAAPADTEAGAEHTDTGVADTEAGAERTAAEPDTEVERTVAEPDTEVEHTAVGVEHIVAVYIGVGEEEWAEHTGARVGTPFLFRKRRKIQHPHQAVCHKLDKILP